MWASGMERQHQRWQTQAATGLYHFGRLATYSLVGAAAGSIGGILDASGQVLGVQLLAAKIVGGLMIVVGLREAWKQLHIRFPKFTQQVWLLHGTWGRLGRRSRPETTAANSPTLAGLLAKLRPQIFALPLPLRGLLTGLLTALLPCGWLYMFALVAAGTGGVAMGTVVMAAFWLGTVPILIALVAGLHGATPKLRNWLPLVASILLIWTGMFTFSGRGFAQLNSLNDIVAQSPVSPLAGNGSKSIPAGGEEPMATTQAAITRAQEQELPCCCHEE